MARKVRRQSARLETKGGYSGSQPAATMKPPRKVPSAAFRKEAGKSPTSRKSA